MRTLAVAALLVGGWAVHAPTPARAANTLMVGPGQTYALPSQASPHTQDGDTVIILGGPTYTDCTFWYSNNLTIEGKNTYPSNNSVTVIGNKTCGSKGVFVLEGNNTTIKDLQLVGATTGNGGNGAGIRVDGTGFTLNDVDIVNNQDGVLANDPTPNHTGKVLVEFSNFSGNGVACPTGQNCTHAIYVNHYAAFTVNKSSFSNTNTGHYVKSRAGATNVTNSNIQDGPTGSSSYLIDAPEGGKVTVKGNIMEHGAHASNKVAISVGEEGVTYKTNLLNINNNQYRNDEGVQTTFVVNDTKASAALVNNVFSGSPVVALYGPGTVH